MHQPAVLPTQVLISSTMNKMRFTAPPSALLL